ncbi:MAG TPA: pseudouridine synthase, partial [Chiayiivirga sp.]|nr:pseudouridine synthase [Chiayiivirga sp.]
HGGLTVSGEQAAKQSQKPFKQRKTKGPKALPEGNPAAFRTWYVPDGVDTGPTGHRNADGRGPKKPYNKKKRPAGQGQGAGQGQARGSGGGAYPYGHPGGAPSFPSDHASPGSHSPYNTRPKGPRPGGQNRPKGPRPGGGNRGPRGGNR